MKPFLSLVALTALGLAVVGCSGTAEGVANDASNNVNAVANAPEAVANGVSNGVNAVGNAVENTGEAVANGVSNGVNAVENVADNAGQAVANGAAAVGNAAENAGQAVANGASAAVNGVANAGSATVVTGAVKLAITANKELNDPKNTINVDTKDGKIVLRGNVATAALKKTAQTIAEKVKKDKGFSETIVNQLTVGAN